MFKTAICLISGGCLLVLAAAPPSIGTVRSNGEFRVDGAAIRGNSTLFEGNLVETSDARSVVQLGSLQLTLLPGSSAKIYHDRTVLQRGSELVSGSGQHVVEAGGLRIASSAVQVEIPAPGRVAVAAREGGAEVRNSTGVLVASMRAGMALAFEPQAAAATAVRMTGILIKTNGKFMLTDVTSHVTVEIQGPDLAKYVGRTIDVSGSIIPGAKPASPASQVVAVSSVHVVGAAGTAGAAGAGGAAGGAGAAGAAGAGVAAGLSGAAVAAIVGGVAVGGTVVGLAAAGTFSGAGSASPK